MSLALWLALWGLWVGCSQGHPVLYMTPSTTAAGQRPLLEVVFQPHHALDGAVVPPNTITLSAYKTTPYAPVPIFNEVDQTCAVPIGLCGVVTGASSQKGTLFTITLNAATATDPACHLDAGATYSFVIPELCMGRNPTVGTVVWLQMVTTTDPTAVIAPPYATSAGLLVHKFSPDALLGANPPSVVTVELTPARDLFAGDTISFVTTSGSDDFFSTQPATQFGTIGRCTANNAQSYAKGNAANVPTSRLIVVLGGEGCVLPRYQKVAFTIQPATWFAPEAGDFVTILVATSQEPTGQPVFVVSAATTTATAATSFGPVVPSTTEAGEVPSTLTIPFTLATPLTAVDTDVIVVGVVPQWVLIPGSTPTATVDQASCPGALTSTAFPADVSFALPTGCTLASGVPITLTISSGLQPNPAWNTTLLFSFYTSKDTRQLYNLPGYTTTGGCGVVPAYTPGTVADIKSLTNESRADLASQIGFLSWTDAFVQPCARSTELTTFVKIPYPAFRVPVAFAGTPPITIVHWGTMHTVPMEAVVVSYPPNSASLAALNIDPKVPYGYRFAWALKVDIFTNAGRLTVFENPFQFVVATRAPTIVLHFEQVGSHGVDLLTIGGIYALVGSPANSSTGLLFVQSPRVSAFLGYEQGPLHVDDDSDDAWLGFLAFLALPLLCCCLLLLLFLRHRRSRPPPCAPCLIPQYQCQQQCACPPVFPQPLMWQPPPPMQFMPPPAYHAPGPYCQPYMPDLPCLPPPFM